MSSSDGHSSASQQQNSEDGRSSAYAESDVAQPSRSLASDLTSGSASRVRFASDDSVINERAESSSSTGTIGPNPDVPPVAEEEENAHAENGDASRTRIGPSSCIDQFEFQISCDSLLRGITDTAVNQTKQRMILKFLRRSARVITHSLDAEDKAVEDFVKLLKSTSTAEVAHGVAAPLFFMFCSELYSDHAGAVFPLEITIVRWTIQHGPSPFVEGGSAIFHCVFGLEFAPTHASATWNENLARKGLEQAVVFKEAADGLNLPDSDRKPPADDGLDYLDGNAECDYLHGISLARLPFQRTEDKFDDLLRFLSDGKYEGKHERGTQRNSDADISSESATFSQDLFAPYPALDNLMVFVPEENLEIAYGTLNFLHAAWKHARPGVVTPEDDLVQNHIFRYERLVAEFMVHGMEKFSKMTRKYPERKPNVSAQLVDIVKLAYRQLYDGVKWASEARCMNHNASDSEHCTFAHAQTMRWLWADYCAVQKIIHTDWKVADLESAAHHCTVYDRIEDQINATVHKPFVKPPPLPANYSRARMNYSSNGGVTSGASVSGHVLRSRNKLVDISSSQSEAAACRRPSEDAGVAAGRGMRSNFNDSSTTLVDAPYTSTFYRGTRRVPDLSDNFRVAPAPEIDAVDGAQPQLNGSVGRGRGRGATISAAV